MTDSHSSSLSRTAPFQEELNVFRRAQDPTQAARDSGAARSGDTIGDFKLLSLIASGGQGEVWKAQQISLGRSVAIKLVLPDRINEKTLALFAREARAGGRLSHPGIVALHAYGESDGKHWIAQELIEGAWTLRNFIDDMRREDQVTGIRLQALGAR